MQGMGIHGIHYNRLCAAQLNFIPVCQPAKIFGTERHALDYAEFVLSVGINQP